MKQVCLFFLLLSLFSCSQKQEYSSDYSVGRDPSWFPLNITQHEPNLNAFTNALIQEIAKLEKTPFEIVNLNWSQLLYELEEENLAAILTPLPVNSMTESKYTFSEPFVFLGPVLVVPYQSQADSLEDLNGKIVGVNQFDDSILIVQNYPSIVIQLYQNMPTALEDLSEGKLDGVLMPTLDAHELVPHLYPKQLKIVTEPLNNKALRLVTLKDEHTDLIEAFNKGLEKLLVSGKYRSLRQKYQLN